MAGKKRGFDEVLDDHCTCPVCMELFDEKIFQCSNGHVLCESCHAKITAKTIAQRKCPQCNIKLGTVRNLIVENIVRARPRPCRHACGASVMDYDTRKQHEKDCKARPYKCPLCDVHITPNNAEQHLTGTHKLIWGRPLSGAPCGTIKVTHPNRQQPVLAWHVLCKVPGGKTCLLALCLSETDFRAVLVAPYGTIGGGPASYTVMVKGHDRSFTFSGPIRHARDVDAAKDAHDCLRIPRSIFCYLSKGENEFDLEIFVSVTG